VLTLQDCAIHLILLGFQFLICTFNLKTLERVSTGQFFKAFCGNS